MIAGKLFSEGKLTGSRKPYPIWIRKIEGRQEKELKIDKVEQLIKLYSEESKLVTSKKKKTWQILEELGIEPMQIIDDRTESLLEEYLFYQKAPHQAPYDSKIWRYTVITLNNILQTGLF